MSSLVVLDYSPNLRLMVCIDMMLHSYIFIFMSSWTPSELLKSFHPCQNMVGALNYPTQAPVSAQKSIQKYPRRFWRVTWTKWIGGVFFLASMTSISDMLPPGFLGPILLKWLFFASESVIIFEFFLYAIATYSTYIPNRQIMQNIMDLYRHNKNSLRITLWMIW